MKENGKKNLIPEILSNKAVQSILAALLCIAAGLLAGFLVLLLIRPHAAASAMLTILRNFLNYPKKAVAVKYIGNTLVKFVPLLMCSLSIQFCYQAGLFNIGAAGQYVAGTGAAIMTALYFKLPWYVCLPAAILAGGLYGAIVALLKTFRNVNEVISGIMLNWISLYGVNMMLSSVKESGSPYTHPISKVNPGALLPTLGLGHLFSNNKYVTIAIPLSVIIAIIIKVVLSRTVFGYEIKATGIAREAARYSGMKEKKNLVITLFIGGALAGAGAAFFFLSGYDQWSCSQSTVPVMGFNGIAAAFLGGLDPIGCIFSSFFIQHITSGGAYLDRTLFPPQISDLISAIIIYLCGFVLFFKLRLNDRIRVWKEKTGNSPSETEPKPQIPDKPGDTVDKEGGEA